MNQQLLRYDLHILVYISLTNAFSNHKGHFLQVILIATQSPPPPPDTAVLIPASASRTATRVFFGITFLVS